MRVRSQIRRGACATFGMVVMAMLGLGGTALAQKPSSGQAEKAAQVFSGVVEEVNPKTMRIVVKTDIGKAVDLEVSNPDLLKDIDKGDRITVEVNEKEKATKIMRSISIPELKGPETLPAEKEGTQPGGR